VLLLTARCSCCDEVRLELDPDEPSNCMVRFVPGAAARPIALGRHRLQLLLGGQHVHGSPYTFDLAPGAPHPPQCFASGAGVHVAARLQRTSATVTACDALGHRCPVGGAELAVALAPCAHGHYGVVHAVVDRGDGTYLISYSADISGKYSLAVTIHGQHIDGSPFRLVVASAEPDGSSPPRRLSRGSASPRGRLQPSSPSAQHSPMPHAPGAVAGSPRLMPVGCSPWGSR
jgi:hypothetical protein